MGREDGLNKEVKRGGRILATWPPWLGPTAGEQGAEIQEYTKSMCIYCNIYSNIGNCISINVFVHVCLVFVEQALWVVPAVPAVLPLLCR